jgi:hypothetical protein
MRNEFARFIPTLLEMTMNFRTALLALPCLVLGAAFSQACTVTSTTNNGADAGSSGSSGSSSGSSGASSSGSSGSSGTVDGGGGDGGSCAFGEPNDTRDQAFPITLGTAYSGCLSDTDKDFYTFTAPADAEGGYVVADITNVTGWVTGRFMTTSDNAEVYADQPANAGASLKLYMAVAPGVKYDFEVEHYVGNDAFAYDMKLTYTKNADPSAAAKTKATAAQLTLGTASPGLFAAGFKTAAIPAADYERYFKVDLAAGPATVKLLNVPSDVWAQYKVIDSANAEVVTTQSANQGASIPAGVVNVPAAGTYYIVPGLYVGAPKAAGQGAVPDSFTKQYTVTVTQP